MILFILHFSINFKSGVFLGNVTFVFKLLIYSIFSRVTNIFETSLYYSFKPLFMQDL